ncbi:centromeric protein E [Nematocida sp. LUAm3]|nr:centromeric protein E [Nematocida sp. LUAm3]
MEKNNRVQVGLRIKPPGEVLGRYPELDKVFSSETNEEIYKEFVYPSVSTLSHATIFTYGRTGSGKTYTMFGEKGNPGLAQRVMLDLLALHGAFSVRCIEIYNEVVTDLLTEEPIKIIQEHDRVRIITQKCIEIRREEEISDLSERIEQKRRTAQTEYNLLSSRSHTIIEITAPGLSVNLVDLAGNEKVGECEKRRKEGLMINISLLTLGKVIDQLHGSASHISYRESNLTRILQNTLASGTIICVCTLLNFTDSLTLHFAKRLKRIHGEIKLLQKSKDEIIEELQKKVCYLTEELLRLKTEAKDNRSSQLPSHYSLIQAESMQEEETYLDSPEDKQQAEIELFNSTCPVEQHVLLDEQRNFEEPSSESLSVICHTMADAASAKSNLYEMVYCYMKNGISKECSNLLTSQEIDQVHLTVTKKKTNTKGSVPVVTMFRESRTETLPFNDHGQSI